MDKMGKRPEIPENITHGEYFNRLLKDRVNNCLIPKISSLNAIIQFEITDDRNGIWNVEVENGLVKEVTKKAVENPTCTFILDSSTFLSIIKREITPQQAFFKGRVHIKGDILLALKMNILVEYL
jgi:putative sterol carrier protein